MERSAHTTRAWGPPLNHRADAGGRHGASWFLARLVARAYAGPRILLSGAMGPDHASSMRRGSVSHFTLTTPWLWGELRSSLVTAMESRALPPEMTRGSRWDESGAP